MRSPFLKDLNTRFESNLLRDALDIPDRGSQIIFLRKELIKIIRIIDEFVKMLNNVDKMYEEDIPAFTMEKFNYTKTSNRSVISSMNDMKKHIGVWLYRSDYEINQKINDIPFKKNGYEKSKKLFMKLLEESV